jgi:hypothetical protein
LRMRPVPLMPSCEATVWSSARRRVERSVTWELTGSVAGISVVSVTEDPSPS